MNGTTYEVRESSRERPEDSTLLWTCLTYAEALDWCRWYAANGQPAFVREVAPSLPPAAPEPDAFDFDGEPLDLGECEA